MEESEVHEGRAGSSTTERRALALTSALVAAAVLVPVLAGASALGQTPPPPPPVYEIPTPTPTGTPFRDTQPPPPPPPASGARLMAPFPVVRTAGLFTRTRTRFTRVTVRAPAGARIEGRCSRRRCKTQTHVLTRPRQVRLRRLQRSYPPRTVLTIRISGADVIGKYVGIRTRAGKPPLRRDRCLEPGGRKPVSCEGA